MAQPAEVDRRALLSRVPLFAELSAAELGLLLESARTRKVARRKEVFHKGEVGEEMYAILSGRLKASAPSRAGKHITFAIMDPGEVFGEIGMLSGAERSATVSALEASELLVIRRRDLLALLERHPRVALKLLAALTNRVRTLSQLVEDTLFLNLPARLAKKLLSLADAYGQSIPYGTRITVKLSQSELANLLATTRESINKQIRAWESQGLVTMAAGHVTVRKPEALRELADLVGL